MPQYTTRFTMVYEVLQGDQFALNGRTQVYVPTTAKLTGADRYESQTWVVSANLSAYPLNLAPLGVSAPMRLLQFLADQPVDIRLNAASDATFFSGVRLLALAAAVSNLFVTTGTAETTVMLMAGGGSNAVLTTSLPLP